MPIIAYCAVFYNIFIMFCQIAGTAAKKGIPEKTDKGLTGNPVAINIFCTLPSASKTPPPIRET